MSHLLNQPLKCQNPFQPMARKVKPTKEFNILHGYPTTNLEDILPVNMISPNKIDGPWIAGGACMQWYQGKSVDAGDIDVFCKSAEQAESLIKRINEELDLSSFDVAITETVESPNAFTFEVTQNRPHQASKKWVIQVIKCKFYDTMQEVIDGFDLSVCKIATDGHQWILGKNTIRDLNDRVLRFDRITKDSPKRLIKYWIYGFIPQPEIFQQLKDNNVRWDFSDDVEYDQSSL